MENGIIQLSRERPNRISLENAEVVQLILRRPLTPDSEAIDVYEGTKASLTKLYGPPESSYRNFKYPYHDGEGDEEYAIKAGKADIITFWGVKVLGAEGLYLQITQPLTVLISYDSSLWHTENDKRKAASDSILKK
jgi:hypothetical protein